MDNQPPPSPSAQASPSGEAAPVPAAAKGGKAKGGKAPRGGSDMARGLQALRQFFRDDAVVEDVIANEADMYRRHKRLLALLSLQGLTAMGLVVAVILLFPVLRPVYIYNVLSPEQQVAEIVGLNMPNVTKRALLSWATTSITEILTLGFGDFDQQLLAQRPRFTEDGWDGFLEGIQEQGLRGEFKSRQLVLTTVPSNTPVVIAEGINKEGIYQWNVEMPVIMTFLTNNDVKKRQKSIIALEIVRVPPRENIQGIAIQAWRVLQ